MKRREFGTTCLAAALATAFGADSLKAARADDSNGAGDAKIRILLVVGGHGYDRENLHKMLADCPNSTFEEISIPEKQDMLKPGLSQNYDVVAFHDQSFFELTDEQKANLEALFGDEGIPTIMLHHALISHPDFPFFRDLYGCQYLLDDAEIDGRKRPKSSYLKPATLDVFVANREHPIIDGVSDFKLEDEVFKNLYINPHVDVLARTDHPESDAPLAWTWRYKKSPVFAIIPGDAGGAFNDPNYRKIVYQAIPWLVAQKAK